MKIASYENSREQLLFPRQQSRALQSAEWESRVQPLVSYATEVLRLIGIIVMVTGLFGAMWAWR